MADKSKTTERLDEVSRRLQAKTQQIESGLSALQEEVVTLGPALRRAIFDHPLVSVGGALVAGLAVGLLFGGRKRVKNGLDLSSSHRALLDRYLDALVDEARHRVGRGQEMGEAVRDALAERAPLIIYDAGPATEEGSVTRRFFDLVLKSAIGFGIKFGLDYVGRSVDLAELFEDDPVEAAEGLEG